VQDIIDIYWEALNKMDEEDEKESIMVIKEK
jgi:hypothetical protein